MSLSQRAIQHLQRGTVLTMEDRKTRMMQRHARRNGHVPVGSEECFCGDCFVDGAEPVVLSLELRG